MTTEHSNRILKLRVRLCQAVALGPGKADLLDAIDRCGSISAAAKDQNMSYRRAWLLVDELNRALSSPVLDTSVAGATLTPTGREILDLYRSIEAKAQAAVADELTRLERLMAEPFPAERKGCTGKNRDTDCL